ncbi:hypothetical protein BH11ARM2_BH11ARM2_25650 [soil metagenome]
MATIASTTLGTSDPVNLCEGFALFPALGTVRAGIQVNNTSKPLFSASPQFLMWKFNADASYGIYFGICGPSYGFRYDAQGSTSNGTISLSVANDQAAGGLIAGLNIGIDATITVQKLSINWVWDGWNSHFATNWNTAWNFTPEIDVDLIGLILTVILYINDQQGDNKNQLLSKVNSISPNLLGSYGFYDQKSNQLASNNGQMSFEPALLIPINLANFIPPLIDINKSLAVIWGGFGFGPQFGISIPTTVQVNDFTVDTSTYNSLSWDGSSVTGTGGTEIASPMNLGCGVAHTPGFDIQFGAWAQVYLLKLFEIGFSTSVDILNLLGITVKIGTYQNSVSSPIGGGPSNTVVGAHAHLEESERIEVILAPPAMVAA